MKMIKILIIGKKSFIGTNLHNYFIKKKIKVKSINYKNFLNKNIANNNFNYIINCTSNKNFIKKKYKKNFDHDLNIAKKISKFNSKLILLSTRKIYKPKFDIKENDLKKPLCNYSKNKLISEKSTKKILKNKILILRISNIIGLPKNHKNKLHQTFIDQFVKFIKKGYLFENNKIFKDFISINKFCEIILNIISKNIVGTYNLSLGKKVYLNQLVQWLNIHNNKKITKLNIKKGFNNDSFTLNNKKLMKKLKIKNSISELKIDCKKISRKLFKINEK
tara:strand:- start:1858 stop:2688 length:831 start_codon:yes stop_codon:yes gene_type:complete